MINPHFSAADKQQYAVLAEFAQALNTASHTVASAAPVGLDADGEWCLLSAHETPLSSVNMHLVTLSPTIEILTDLLQALALEIRVGSFRFHPQSDWLNGLVGIVIPIMATDIDETAINAVLAKIAKAYNAEIAVINRGPCLSKPGLLVMDMDSTVIAAECIDEIAQLAGVGASVAMVTEQAMRGELDFAESLRARVACLAGLDLSALEQVKRALPPMRGLSRLLLTLQKYDWKIAIASGGFTYFADHLASRFELDGAFANQLGESDGKLNGELVGDIVDAQGKANVVKQLASEWQIGAEQTVAMGDGANDLLMMSAAGLGVAFHAKPIVEAQAQVAIRHTGLDTLLLMLT